MSSSETSLLTLFTGVVAVAFLLQSLAVVGIYRVVRQLSIRLDDISTQVTKNIASVAGSLDELLSTVRHVAEKIEVIQDQVSATSAIIHKRVTDLDGFLEGTIDAARLQVAKFQDLVDTSSTKIEETLDTVQRGILAPISEFTALVRGLKVGLGFLFRGRRNPSARSHQDEEMFI